MCEHQPNLRFLRRMYVSLSLLCTPVSHTLAYASHTFLHLLQANGDTISSSGKRSPIASTACQLLPLSTRKSSQCMVVSPLIFSQWSRFVELCDPRTFRTLVRFLGSSFHDQPIMVTMQSGTDIVRHPGLLCDLLWSDPDKDITGWSENDRGVSFTFGPDVVSRFLQKHDMDLICRAHQVRSVLSTISSCLDSANDGHQKPFRWWGRLYLSSLYSHVGHMTPIGADSVSTGR